MISLFYSSSVYHISSPFFLAEQGAVNSVIFKKKFKVFCQPWIYVRKIFANHETFFKNQVSNQTRFVMSLQVYSALNNRSKCISLVCLQKKKKKILFQFEFSFSYDRVMIGNKELITVVMINIITMKKWGGKKTNCICLWVIKKLSHLWYQ